MWDKIIDVLGVELSVILHNKPDDELVGIFLGAQWELQDVNVYDKFIVLISKYYSWLYDICIGSLYNNIA